MKFIPLPPSKQPLTIDPSELKQLALAYGNRHEIAKALKMHYSQFCWKVSQSASLSRILKSALKEFEKNQVKI